MLASLSEAQVVNPNTWVTNGSENTIATSGRTSYLGGNFSYFGRANAGVLALADSSAASASSPSTGRAKSGLSAFMASFLATAALGGAAFVVQANTGDQDHQSALGTTAALGITAYLAGPSIGHFYAGRPRRAWVGIGARGLIGLGFTATLVTLIDEGSDNDQGPLSIAFMVAGAGAVVADIVDAPRSVHIHNEKVRRMAIGPAPVGGAPGVRIDVGF